MRESAGHQIQTFYTASRGAWRRWLRKYHKTRKEVWLVYYRKESGKGRIAYNDAVEEALCFGWIDSTVRKLDEERFAQRFSPRRPNSPYSQANIERLRRLKAEGKVTAEVRAALTKALMRDRPIPADIRKALRADKTTWENFQKFSAAYRRIRIAFIEGARRRPAEFRKRLDYFIRMTEKGRKFGFGGIQKYY